MAALPIVSECATRPFYSRLWLTPLSYRSSLSHSPHRLLLPSLPQTVASFAPVGAFVAGGVPPWRSGGLSLMSLSGNAFSALAGGGAADDDDDDEASWRGLT
jgi:hypothetical protein